MNKRLLLVFAGLAWPAAVWAAPQALVIDPGASTIQVDVTVTLDSFVAQLQNFQVDIALDPARAEVTAAALHFHFSDLRSGDAERDAAMDAWEDIAQYPDGSFVLTGVLSGAHGRFLAHGRLDFHGVVRPVVFPVTVTLQNGTLSIDGQAALDTRDYGLPIFRKFYFIRVDPTVRVRFHLQGKLAGP